MTTTRMPEADACPLCRHVINAATPGIGEEQNAVPREGDVSICIHCGGVLVFGRGLKMRQATVSELREVLADPNTVRTLKAIEQARPPAHE